MRDWSDWPKAYYTETKREDRLQMLEERLQSDLADEQDRIRRQMWDLRYQKRDKMPDGVDYFIRSWMEMFFLSQKMGKRFQKKERYVKELAQIKQDFGFDLIKPYGKAGEEVLYEELCNGVALYIKLCQTDRQYGSILCGLMRMKPKDLVSKIGNELHRITEELPAWLEAEEDFAPLARACREVFWREYPEYKKEETIRLERS